MAKSREELLHMLQASFNRDGGLMNWRTVYLATVDSFKNRQYSQAKAYINDLSLLDLRTCRDLLEDLFVDEFIDKFRSHIIGGQKMTELEINSYEEELNLLLPDEKIKYLVAKQDEILEQVLAMEPAVEEEPVVAAAPKKSKKQSNDKKN
jgi:hypothetical protein